MLLSKSVREDLRFTILLEALGVYCHSSHTKTRIAEIQPGSTAYQVIQVQRLTEEILQVMHRGDGIPIEQIPDVPAWVDLIRIEGNLLTPDQFFELKHFLGISRRIRQFCSTQKLEAWQEFSENLFQSREGESEIDRVFDEDRNVQSSASPELKRIRRAIESVEASIQRRMQEIFGNARSNDWLNGDKIVWRDGRLALPMSASHKRKVKGIVHGASSTGQTSYVEPLEIVEKNNELTELRSEEKSEVYRILQQLTSFFRPHVQALDQSFQIILQFDQHYAFASLARKFDGVKPVFTEDGSIKIVRGRNPQLALGHREVIPLNLELSGENRSLILSGPNAGGKTVVLKTIGIYALMAQCGFFLPAKEVQLPLFSGILVDIGDQQSVEDDLSTFSAHIQNVIEIIEHADDHSLILMDELGTGTDPDAGASISRAVLEELLIRRSHVIATSHLGQLKLWAHDTPGILNGGMKFDPDELAPTYELIVGTPGGSYALEISKRTGLQSDIIDRASELIGDSSIKLENLLSQLEHQQSMSRSLEEELRGREAVIANREQIIAQKQSEIDEKFKKARTEANLMAKQIVENARRDTEHLVHNIKQHKADHTSVQTAKKSFATRIKRLEKKIVTSEDKPRNPLDRSQAAAGLRVHIPHLDGDGTLVTPPDKKGQVTVEINGIKFRLMLDQLVAAEPEKKRRSTPRPPVATSISRPESFQIDLRGKRVDEALEDVIQFLDRAMLSGLTSVHILHGKGTGALQEAVRDYLKTAKFIKSFDFARPEQGGAGITIAEFR